MNNNDHYKKCRANPMIDAATVADFPRGTCIRMYTIADDGSFQTHAMAGHTATAGEWYIELNPATLGEFAATLTVDQIDDMLTMLTKHGLRMSVQIPIGADTPLAKTATA